MSDSVSQFVFSHFFGGSFWKTEEDNYFLINFAGGGNFSSHCFKNDEISGRAFNLFKYGTFLNQQMRNLESESVEKNWIKKRKERKTKFFDCSMRPFPLR